MKFVLNRNYALRTTRGYMLDFVKGVPLDVPAIIENEVIAIGGECVDGKVDPLGDEPVEKVIPQGSDREAIIMAAMEDMANSNKRSDFTAQGLPHVKVIEKTVGFEIDTHERDRLWTKLRTGE